MATLASISIRTNSLAVGTVLLTRRPPGRPTRRRGRPAGPRRPACRSTATGRPRSPRGLPRAAAGRAPARPATWPARCGATATTPAGSGRRRSAAWPWAAPGGRRSARPRARGGRRRSRP
ncbi:hypothetical protein [Ornithinimicrobium kibberense]|uniref:hypothetical protein n=1 Tax=Ornithinimicrobium kibberense TaxID=282060 RepID=UPI003608604C